MCVPNVCVHTCDVCPCSNSTEGQARTAKHVMLALAPACVLEAKRVKGTGLTAILVESRGRQGSHGHVKFVIRE